MPLLVEEFVVGLAPSDAACACRRAAADFGWRIEADKRDEILIALPRLAGGREAALDVRFAPADDSQTRVSLQGGIGLPAQFDTRNLRADILRMRSAILSIGARAATSDMAAHGAAGHPPERQRARTDRPPAGTPEDEAAALSELRLQIERDLSTPRSSSSSTVLLVLLVAIAIAIAIGALVSLELSRGGGATPSGGLTVQQVYSQIQKALQQGTLPQGTDTVNQP
ncbi:MAG: hypothetical protein ACLP8S_15245 [Solirubrobacteraceae bacterium]